MIHPWKNIYFRRSVKAAAWCIGAIVVLLVALTVLLQVHSVQNYIVQTVLSPISARTGTRIELGSVSISLPNSVVVKHLFIEGASRDTLLAVAEVRVDIDLVRLLFRNVSVTSLHIDSLTAHVTRTLPDSAFNFSFLIRALSSDTTASAAAPDTLGSTPWTIGLSRLMLSSIDVTYVDEPSGLDVAARIGSLACSMDEFDIAANRYHAASFTLTHSTVAVSRSKASPVDTSASEPMDVALGTVLLAHVNVRYDDTAPQSGSIPDKIRTNSRSVDPRGGIDPRHLDLRDLSLAADHLSLVGTSIRAHVDHASAAERSGLEIRDLAFTAAMDSVHCAVDNFFLATPSSAIRLDARLGYRSLSDLASRPGEVTLKAAVHDSHVGIADMLLFIPSLPVKHSNRTVRLAANFSGRINNIAIEKFHASAGDSTVVDVTGTVRGLPNAGSAAYDITVHTIASGRNDIRLFVPDSLLPNQVDVPASMRISGMFNGTASGFQAAADIRTTIGSVSATASLSGGAAPQWKAHMSADRFDLGALTKDSSLLGPVTFSADAEGSGVTKQDLRAHISLSADEATLLGYPYRHLTADGTASADMFDGTIALRDSNIVVDFVGFVNIGGEHPSSNFMVTLEGADLHALHLTEEDLRISGVLYSDITGGTVDSINGSADLRNLVILKDDKRFTIDSLVLSARNVNHTTQIDIQSPVFGATYNGNIPLGKLPAALRQHFNHYFTLHDSTTAKADSQSFSVSVELRDPATITGVLLPSLTRLEAGTIEAHYSSASNDLSVNIGLNSIAYDDMTIDSLQFTAASDARQLRGSLRMGTFAYSQFVLPNVVADAAVEHDSIDVSVISTDANGGTTLFLAGIINSISNAYQFHFKPEGIVLHDRQWSVPADHFLTFGKGSLIAHHIVLSDTGQALSIQSTNEAAMSSPLKIDFSKFSLGALSHIVERDSGFVGGTIDGTIELRDMDKTMAFTSDLSVGGFTFGRKPVGDVLLRASTAAPGTYDVAMVLTGNENRVGMQGHYTSGKTGSTLDLDVEVGALNLASVEPFTFGSATRLSGIMTGAVHVTGTTVKPSITGTLNFADAGFNLSMLNSYLRLHNGAIGFDARGIELRSITLVDTLNNSASITGYLTTGDFRTYGYDMTVHTKKFLLMNKPRDPDALYYGTVFIDSDIRMKGTQARPVIDVQAKLDKGTSVTIVMPESGSEALDREGIVSFVDVKRPGSPVMQRKAASRATDDSLKSAFGGIDLTSNIEVTKDAKLRILVDPVSGDSLVAQGDATFSVGMYPSGQLSVTGRYEISEGSYLVSFGSLLKRDFKIEKGSSLTWFGTPFDANIAITAIYTVKASALDLVQDQIAGMSQEERTKYRQELPIEVYLTMKGRLLKPEISFRLDLPEAQRGALGGTILTKLNEINMQDSELNKQVFALLMLGRFIPSDPLSLSGEGTGLTDIARSSVSNLLAAQLNRLSQQYVKAVDVNVGLESGKDYSTGTIENRTQLQLGLSKTLFDERVTVQVGGNVDLEGPRTQQNSLNNFSGNIKVGYKLTEDGRWQLTVFRQQAYEGVIEGDLTETGVGLVFTIDYDTLVGFTLKPVGSTNETESR